MAHMTQAERIIERFGGITRLAKALGHRHPTTVQGWKNSGYIPARRQQAVLDAAAHEGVPLAPTDFFDEPEIAGVA